MTSTGTKERSKYNLLLKKTKFIFTYHKSCAKMTPIMNIKTPVAIKETIIDGKR